MLYMCSPQGFDRPEVESSSWVRDGVLGQSSRHMRPNIHHEEDAISGSWT